METAVTRQMVKSLVLPPGKTVNMFLHVDTRMAPPDKTCNTEIHEDKYIVCSLKRSAVSKQYIWVQNNPDYTTPGVKLLNKLRVITNVSPRNLIEVGS